ncbi:chorismate--pyruvate lyase family protein [Neisseria montereyensis]|uniref:Chorismate lyase n=1 Tax=Neisseria montereyensis TaxID=2973938 RepID=A0ABT2FAL5_9NEIS|nr:chorismate lyase [Neisseria montereyensis]MCS4532784.1 chorismate lyase [Neisseria montereyensis]
MNNPSIWQPELPEHLTDTYPADLTALIQAQSLTAALRAIDASFSVRLLHLGATHCDILFSDGLTITTPDNGFGRDVLLCLNDIPVVWARSLCAADAQNWRNLLDCGTRPLGERLFDGSLPLTRSAFEYAILPETYRFNGFEKPSFLARRSFFDLQGERLGLTECFLPALQSFV